MVNRHRHRIVCWGLSLIVFFACVAVQPAAQAGIFRISTQDEISMGRDVARDLEKKYGVVDDPELQERVAAIGARIAARSERKDIKYTFKVLNSKDINALAVPGGHIYLFKGLTDYMASDDELAGIIGHEVVHVAKRHSVKQMEKSMDIRLVYTLLTGGRSQGNQQLLVNLLYSAVMAGHSRDDEQEADKVGFYYSTAAGYNPYSMLLGLQRLAELDNKGHYGLFATHPEPERRVELVERYMADAKIAAKVVRTGKSARVVGQGLELPALYAVHHNYRPHHRAYFLAGRLHRLSERPDLREGRFMAVENGEYITIFYDDYSLLTLTPEDAAGNRTSLGELARQYVACLEKWARI